MNGANYQHSGTENLRGNQTSEHAPVTSDKGPTHNTIAAPYQKAGTENLRGNERDYHVPIVTGKANGAPRPNPNTVDTFKDSCV